MMWWGPLLQGGAQLQATATAYVLDTTPGSYALNGSSPELLFNRQVDTTAGNYTLSGSSPELLYTRILDTAPGTYALNGVSATLDYGKALDTTPGSYSLAGSSATTLYARLIITTSGNYALVGSSAELVYTQLTNYVLDTTPGSYSLSGYPANLTYVSAAAAGAFDRNNSLETVPTKAPNLTIPSQVYDVRQQQQLVNQLRLYFVGVDNATAALIQTTNTLNALTWIDC